MRVEGWGLRVEGGGWRVNVWAERQGTGFRSASPAKFSAREQLHYRNVKRFRGGLVFKAYRLVYHSTLGLRVIKKKKKHGVQEFQPCEVFCQCRGARGSGGLGFKVWD